MNIKTLSYVWCIAMAACASHGFDRGKINAQLGTRIVTEEEIQKTLALKPQLKFPFKMAIYTHEYTRHDPEYKELSDMCNRLNGIIFQCMFMDSTAVPSSPSTERGYRYYPAAYDYPELRNIRLAAARYQADTVLTLRSAVDIDEYSNPLSFFYITIVGCWLSPGSHRDALVVYSGSLWDVGNEYLYATAQAEATGSIVRPFVFADQKVAIEKGRQLAIKEFSNELSERIRNLHGSK